MSKLRRIALLGNYLPRRCGIATFTHDLHQAIAQAAPDIDTFVVAMTDAGQAYDYPGVVRFDIRADDASAYVRTADALNASNVDVVCLQHEYGIFGGPDGALLLDLVARLNMPVVSTLHTVLSEPSVNQKHVLKQVVGLSSKTVVMSQKGRELLGSVYAVPDDKIAVIPHGIPDYPLRDPGEAKARFGFSDRTLLLTFGLLSPNKGIEYMIDAMPEIVRGCPDALYVVLGATHPTLLRENGDSYREDLVARVNRLGLGGHVVFINQFVEQALLLEYISMCDIYVTPYLSEAQMTSGTLAYSFGLGKPVVSTPYWHAKELLADGRGILVPFASSDRLSIEISTLLANGRQRQSMRARAYAESRCMTWARTAERYLDVLQDARARPTISAPALVPSPAIPRFTPLRRTPLPTQHLNTLCDSTGISQHAVFGVPDRAHGYCVDDNARALLLAVALAHAGEPALPEVLTSRFAAFVQHAWNPDTRRFRNFMSYERRWLEPTGSEDSHGRTLWALGECALKDPNIARQPWAADLFRSAAPIASDFTSPRAQAFTLLGLNAMLRMDPGNGPLAEQRMLLADRLLAAVDFTALEDSARSADWCWFEEVLAYDNARLPQALLETGVATGNSAYREAGLRTLRWLARVQTAPSGDFRPVGSDSFGHRRQPPLPFDQQPLEAWASLSAYISAWRIEGNAAWITEAARAFAWFSGRNDLNTSLVDPVTGACCDGLHKDRRNLNQGAESCLAYLHSLVEMRDVQRQLAAKGHRTSPKLVTPAPAEVATPMYNRGGLYASNGIFEPPSPALAT